MTSSETVQKLPENLATLESVERLMQQRSVAHIEADEALLDHVELIEAVMNHIDYFAKRDSTGDLDLETMAWAEEQANLADPAHDGASAVFELLASVGEWT